MSFKVDYGFGVGKVYLCRFNSFIIISFFDIDDRRGDRVV